MGAPAPEKGDEERRVELGPGAGPAVEGAEKRPDEVEVAKRADLPPPKTGEEIRAERIRRDFEREVPLLQGENIREKLNPHPLSFFSYFAHGLVLLIIAFLLLLLFISGPWAQLSSQLGGIGTPIGLGNLHGPAGTAAAYLLLIILMVFFGVIAGRLMQEMGGYWFTVGYFLILAGAIVFGYFSPFDYKVNIPLYLVLVTIVVFLLCDLYRRAFRYFITSHRVVLVRKFVTHDEIFLRYDKIVDVDVHQGVIARLFGFGTIIPITASAIGTGQDAVTIAGDTIKDRRLQGPLDRGTVVATTKSVQTGRARPDDSLFGVPNPFRVKALIAEMMEGQSEQTKLQEIANLLRQRAGQPAVEKPEFRAPAK